MSAVVSTKFDPEELALLKKTAKLRGEDMSSFIRRAAMLELGRLRLLSSDRMRALGLVEDFSGRQVDRWRELPPRSLTEGE